MLHWMSNLLGANTGVIRRSRTTLPHEFRFQFATLFCHCAFQRRLHLLNQTPLGKTRDASTIKYRSETELLPPTFITMPDFHIVPCSCHGQMIWVRAMGVFGHPNTQVSQVAPSALPQRVTNLPLQMADRVLENPGSIVGFDPTQPPTNTSILPQSMIDPTLIGGAAAIRPTVTIPITFPAVHCGVCGAIEVPQRQYRSAPLSPDPTYENGENIIFSKGGGCGVPVVDAAEYRLSDLLGGDDLVFADTAVSTFSVRIEVREYLGSVRYTGTDQVSIQWPGYKMWNGQVSISGSCVVLQN